MITVVRADELQLIEPQRVDLGRILGACLRAEREQVQRNRQRGEK